MYFENLISRTVDADRIFTTATTTTLIIITLKTNGIIWKVGRELLKK